MSDARPAKRVQGIAEPPAAEPRGGFTAVGRVVKPHGIRGEVRVQAFNPSGQNIQAGRFVFVAGERHKVLRARPDRGGWILQLSRLATRDTAEAARGQLLEVPDVDVTRDDPESYFVHELIGLRVVTSGGIEVGRITDVLQPGANDVYVVSGRGGEVLVPAIDDVVRSVDVGAGEVVITPLSEWLDESE
jgi:16S rRNA processing protein RimM